MTTAQVMWFKDVDKNDIALVGGKGANLGEMVKFNFPVPDGFIVTSSAYYQFLKENNLNIKIKHLLQTTNFDNSDSLSQISNHIKKLIIDSDLNETLAKEVYSAYKRLGGIFKDGLVAVRSSATAEDLPGASFAGQQETYLNVKGEANLLIAIKDAWASLFNARAIFYRHQQNFDHFRIGIAIVVQKMVESEKSGIMFTIDPVTNDKSKIVIEAIFGLGEMIVQGQVNPDHYEVSKKEEKIINKDVNAQTFMMKKVGKLNKIIKLPKSIGLKQKLTSSQIIALASIGKKLEKHYYFPQDSEWAIEKNKIYIVQTRPITTVGKKSETAKQDKENQSKTSNLKLIISGDPASPGIATGPARVINSAREIGTVLSGEILVAPQTNPDFVPAMKKAVAIVTDSGGRTSHAAIVSRELGIPAVVGSQKATKLIKTGNIITVNGSKGLVFKGGLLSSTVAIPKLIESRSYIKTATKVYVNLAEPELAQNISIKNVDGIGLLRAEFMMAQIGIHPKKLIHDHKKQMYINKLAEGLQSFCQAFYPRPVVYRTSDFKTNEYRNLVGGKDYEAIEPNPMLGFRGTFRYISDPEVFELELEAVKKVRETHKNLWIMLPFVRTVRELVTAKKIISSAGLYRSESFKLWMMVEIPSNVILLDKFIYAGIDGVSIGSNDLTMLLLGTDRDNSEVAREFDEQNEAVLWALEHVIKIAHKHRITSSICGQAASSYPHLLEKLVSWGITSVSVSPDAIENTRRTIMEIERKMLR
ncbi:MAG: phosphoenolpyruvate synthase [Candidatus Levybacteria bacterium]|nr:phosphoenolpyruvate synthase [Candidatus Levybacteria bacterium]